MPPSFARSSWMPGQLARGFTGDGCSYVVLVRRRGVEASGGFLLAVPVWLWTRLRWQLDRKRSWSVELTEMNRSGIGGRRLHQRLYPSRSEALRAADELLRAGPPAT